MATQRMGSTRLITPVEPGVIQLTYTDYWSAFDRGSSRQPIPGIGEARCACAVKSFEVAQLRGFPTHFLKQISSVAIQVMEYSVPGREPLSGLVHGEVLPLEWIWRVKAKGSLLKRIEEKKIDPVSLGFEPGTKVVDNMPLPKTFLECTTKFEIVDRHLSDEDAMQLAKLSEVEWGRVWDLIDRAVRVSNRYYEAAGFFCPDGKLEVGADRWDAFGMFPRIVDVFGTPDENRIIDTATGELYSKDLIRNYLASLPWKYELDAAKEEFPADKKRWPEYPILPDELVELVSARYREVADRYTSVILDN